MESNLEKINESDEKTLEKLKKRIEYLKNKEKDVYELGDFSKKTYITSIPVMLLFTFFIDLICSNSFNIQEYLVLNSISMPSILMFNTFICGTTKSRKRKLIIIGDEIQATEREISTLAKKITESNKTVNNKSQDNFGIFQIKPIERKFKVGNNKRLVKKIAK